MTQEEYEFVRIACRYSKSRKQAKSVVMSSFKMRSMPESPWKSKVEKEIDRFISREWKSSKKINKYTLRGKTIKELVMLVELLNRERGIVFEKVLIPIKKRIEGNHLPRDLYDLIIKDSTKEKESMRGNYVELNSISKDGLVMHCTYKHYCFMVHDIDCSKNLIFI